MPHRSLCLTTELFLGRPQPIKTSLNDFSEERFWVDLKQTVFSGFFFLLLKLHCCVTLLFIFESSYLLRCRFCSETDQNNAPNASTRCPAQLLSTRQLKLHRTKLQTCCCWCVSGREARRRPVSQDEWTYACCACTEINTYCDPPSSFPWCIAL